MAYNSPLGENSIFNPLIESPTSFDDKMDYHTPTNSFVNNRSAIVVSNDNDSIDYHIYYDSIKIEKHVPNSINVESCTVKYYIHDCDNNQFLIWETNIDKITKRENGKIINSIPPNYSYTYNYPNGGDAGTAYVYANGDIIADGPKSGYGIRKYSPANSYVDIIRMPDSLSRQEKNFCLFYEFFNTQRRYCNPGAFAGLLGVLAYLGFKDIKLTGMCFGDGTSYPSQTHPNGDSIDTLYLSSQDREQSKIDAFKLFNFLNIYKGKICTDVNGKVVKKPKSNQLWILNLTNATPHCSHNDHLHAGEFDEANFVKIITKKNY